MTKEEWNRFSSEEKENILKKYNFSDEYCKYYDLKNKKWSNLPNGVKREFTYYNPENIQENT